MSRSSFAYKPEEEDLDGPRIMRLIDGIYLIDPCNGVRRLVKRLSKNGTRANPKRILRLRRKMERWRGQTVRCRLRRTSLADNPHRNHPYLLH